MKGISRVFRWRSVALAAWASLWLAPCLPAAERSLSFSAALDSITVADLGRHLGYLAHEGLEGREAGSRGGHLAGDYLASELKRIGLAPAGDQGTYLQVFAPNYRNLLGIAEGSDPQLKREVILVCAHYDHVGYGNQRNSRGPWGYVHPGADDNASGSAGLMELAEALMLLGERPKRSVLFVLTDAEEKGLLGMRHWFAHPTLPVERVVFGLDLDMIGRVRNDTLKVFGSRTAAGLRRLVSEQNEPGLRLEFPWLMRGNGDHWLFFERGIPVLLLNSGEHEDYHRPSDRLEKLNQEDERRVVRLAFSLTYELAQRSRLLAFREASRHETPEAEKALRETPARVIDRLGAECDPLDDAPVVRHVTPGSPADVAGLLPHDRVLRMAGREIRTARDLTEAVRVSPKRAAISVQRRGETKPLELHAVLEGDPIRVGITWRIDDAEPDTVILSHVVPGSPAAQAGLAVGDRILKLAGRQFATEAEFARLIRALPGPIELVIERDGRLMRIVVHLHNAPIRRAA
jgi:hypothetical protein